MKPETRRVSQSGAALCRSALKNYDFTTQRNRSGEFPEWRVYLRERRENLHEFRKRHTTKNHRRRAMIAFSGQEALDETA
jgi:predicted lipase